MGGLALRKKFGSPLIRLRKHGIRIAMPLQERYWYRIFFGIRKRYWPCAGVGGCYFNSYLVNMVSRPYLNLHLCYIIGRKWGGNWIRGATIYRSYLCISSQSTYLSPFLLHSYLPKNGFWVSWKFIWRSGTWFISQIIVHNIRPNHRHVCLRSKQLICVRMCTRVWEK